MNWIWNAMKNRQTLRFWENEGTLWNQSAMKYYPRCYMICKDVLMIFKNMELYFYWENLEIDDFIKIDKLGQNEVLWSDNLQIAL